MKKTVGFAVDLRTSVPMHVSVHCFTFQQPGLRAAFSDSEARRAAGQAIRAKRKNHFMRV